MTVQSLFQKLQSSCYMIAYAFVSNCFAGDGIIIV